jgi:hypothetical protein
LDYGDRSTGVVKKVRVIDILKRVQKYPIKFFYGPIMQLNFDLERYGWPRSVSLLQYSTKMLEDGLVTWTSQ